MLDAQRIIPSRPSILPTVLTGLLTLIVGFSSALAEEKPSHTEKTEEVHPPLQSGREIGETIPSFYVRAVTGPLMNQSVCYVCRCGDRPVVMVLIRRLEPELKDLLKEIDEVVDEQRELGLRTFAVYLSEKPVQAFPKIQTLAFDEEIHLPLTVATPVVGRPECQNVHPQAAVTVVLYEEREVVSSFAFRPGKMKPQKIRKVVDAVEQLAR